LFSTTVFAAPGAAPLIWMPSAVLPEMTLRSAAAVPPMRLLLAATPPVLMYTPTWLPGPGAVPARSVPRKLPTMTLLDDPKMRMARVGQRLITSPRIVLPELPTPRFSAPFPPHAAALSSMTGAKGGAATNPGCVVPSIRTTDAIEGSAEPRRMVLAPAGAMLNWMSSVPAKALASSIAARKVQTAPAVAQFPSPKEASPASPTSLTRKTAANADSTPGPIPSKSERSHTRALIARKVNSKKSATSARDSNVWAQ
jgi:hypothetical protein